HADLLGHAEQAEHLEQHRNNDGTAADAEQPGEQAGDDAGSHYGQGKPDQLAERHPGHRSTAAEAAQKLRQLGNALPGFATIDRVLDGGYPVRDDYNAGKLVKFFADLGFGKGLLEITPMTLAGMSAGAAVSQGHGDAGWAQARRHSGHCRIFGDLDTV